MGPQMVEDMTIKILIPILLLGFLSCGRSPFEYELRDASDSFIKGEDNQEIVYKLDDYSFRFSRSKKFVLYEENKISIISDIEENSLDNYNIYLWMPEHGHGSYPISIKYLGESLFELKDVYFTMPGYWTLVIENKDTKKEIKWPIYL